MSSKIYKICKNRKNKIKAFAGVITRELPASFRVVYDKNHVTSFSFGASNLQISSGDDNLVVSSSLGRMEIKPSNESFVIESVPSPSDLEKTEVVASNGNENDKYDIVNDKLQSSTEAPKIDCMDSDLKELIVKCEGNLRLRKFTEQERKKAEETRAKVKEQLEQKLKEFQNRMRETQERLLKNFQGFQGKVDYHD